MTVRKLVHPSFSYADSTEDELKALWQAFYPAGSGPLSVMRMVCALIETIAHMRGFDVAKWGDTHQSTRK